MTRSPLPRPLALALCAALLLTGCAQGAGSGAAAAYDPQRHASLEGHADDLVAVAQAHAAEGAGPAIFVAPNAGIHLATASTSRNLPSSNSVISAVQMIGLVIE